MNRFGSVQQAWVENGLAYRQCGNSRIDDSTMLFDHISGCRICRKTGRQLIIMCKISSDRNLWILSGYTNRVGGMGNGLIDDGLLQRRLMFESIINALVQGQVHTLSGKCLSCCLTLNNYKIKTENKNGKSAGKCKVDLKTWPS
jgi:hypothetical protein